MPSAVTQGMTGWGLRWDPIRNATRTRGRAFAGSPVRGSLSRAILALDRSAELGSPSASGLSAEGGRLGRHGECCPRERPGQGLDPSAILYADGLAPGGLCGVALTASVAPGPDVAEPPYSLKL